MKTLKMYKYIWASIDNRTTHLLFINTIATHSNTRIKLIQVFVFGLQYDVTLAKGHSNMKKFFFCVKIQEIPTSNNNKIQKTMIAMNGLKKDRKRHTYERNFKTGYWLFISRILYFDFGIKYCVLVSFQLDSCKYIFRRKQALILRWTSRVHYFHKYFYRMGVWRLWCVEPHAVSLGEYFR